MDSESEIAREHDALRGEIGLLRTLVEAVARDNGPDAVLARRVAQLCERLRRHFAAEESGGYLAAVTQRRPGLAHTVDRLRQEHAALLAEGDELHTLLNSAADLPVRVLRLLDELTRHELAEQDLVQRAVIDDLGAGD